MRARVGAGLSGGPPEAGVGAGRSGPVRGPTKWTNLDHGRDRSGPRAPGPTSPDRRCPAQDRPDQDPGPELPPLSRRDSVEPGVAQLWAWPNRPLRGGDHDEPGRRNAVDPATGSRWSLIDDRRKTRHSKYPPICFRATAAGRPQVGTRRRRASAMNQQCVPGYPRKANMHGGLRNGDLRRGTGGSNSTPSLGSRMLSVADERSRGPT